jgi:uncharacterized protein (DUF983 family)
LVALEGGEMAKTFVQWKGTDLCMDLYCPECGESSHFDGFFAYHIRCPNCKAVFKMPQDLAIERVPEEPGMQILDAEEEQ